MRRRLESTGLWGSNMTGHVYTNFEAGMLFTGFLMIYFTLTKIGQGVFKWAILLVALHLGEMLTLDKNNLIINRDTYLLIKAFIVTTMTIAFFTYYHLRKKRTASEDGLE